MSVAARSRVTRHLVSVALVLAGLGFACGRTTRDTASDSTGDITGEHGIPITDLIEEMARAWCVTVMTCDIAQSDALLNRIAHGSVEECVATFTAAAQREREITHWVQLVEEVRIEYDPLAARQALDQVAASCRVGIAFGFRWYFPTPFFHGTVQLGDNCRRHEECVGDAFCASPDETCPGVCTARAQPGAECRTDEQCSARPGSIADCDDVCFEEEVLPDVGPDEPCGGDPSCVHGFVCRDGTCQPPIAAGEPCTGPDDTCEDGHFCLPDAEGDTRCQRLIMVGIGEACVDERSAEPDPTSGIIQYCNPYENAHCVNGVCEQLSDGSLGSPCRDSIFAAGELTNLCDEGLYCRPSTVECQELRRIGEPCEFGGHDSACETRRCDPVDYVCEEYCAAR